MGDDLGNRTYSCIWGVGSNGKVKCNRSLMTNAYGVKSSKSTFKNYFDGGPLKSVVFTINICILGSAWHPRKDPYVSINLKWLNGNSSINGDLMWFHSEQW